MMSSKIIMKLKKNKKKRKVLKTKDLPEARF